MKVRSILGGAAGGVLTYTTGLSTVAYNAAGALVATLGAPAAIVGGAALAGTAGAIYGGYQVGKNILPGVRDQTKELVGKGRESFKNRIGPKTQELRNNISNSLSNTFNPTAIKDRVNQGIAQRKIDTIRQEKEKINQTLNTQVDIVEDFKELQKCFDDRLAEITDPSDLSILNKYLTAKRTYGLQDENIIDIHIDEGRGSRSGELDKNDYIRCKYDAKSNTLIPTQYVTEGRDFKALEKDIKNIYSAIDTIKNNLDALNITKDSDHKTLDSHHREYKAYKQSLSLLQQKFKDLTINKRKPNLYKSLQS